jgi:hypothetical protein
MLSLYRNVLLRSLLHGINTCSLAISAPSAELTQPWA